MKILILVAIGVSVPTLIIFLSELIIFAAFRRCSVCSVCKGKGKYYVPPFLTKTKGTWINCECKKKTTTDEYCQCSPSYYCRFCDKNGLKFLGGY